MTTKSSTVGQIERKAQNRVVKLFQEKLNYQYLGNLEDQDNKNLKTDLLKEYLKGKYSDDLISRAIYAFEKVNDDTSKSLYDVNKEIYGLLRKGVNVSPGTGQNNVDVKFIDWVNPLNNHFAIAEEVTVKGKNEKRPDIVVYINGIALAVIELKRSTVSVSEGIRQNLDNQKKDFIQHFYNTIQILVAGNDTQGIRYGTINTTETYYLHWNEDSDIKNSLDRGIQQLFEKKRFIELAHDYILFDAGIKKIPRYNQYFGVKAAQAKLRNKQGGILWHTQGSGKSLTMVMLSRWVRENLTDARVLVITDRTELDQQIEGDFIGAGESIYRCKSAADLIEKINASQPSLLCSLVHKFGHQEGDDDDVDGYIDDIKKHLPKDFKPKGNFYVFVDECHRTQSGRLHSAMKEILPQAVFVGFTGTPLLKKDKAKSIEIFGEYIHTYKFDEAVRDGVVLDLRYEARNIDQDITSPGKIDQWFAAKTRGLNDSAVAQLKQRWGTLRSVFSARERLQRIVADIIFDMETKDRLKSGRGNAMFVTDSIYSACRVYQMFLDKGFDKCAIITSYAPLASQIKGEETGEGKTEKILQYEVYRKMLASWFNESEDKACTKVDEFEKQVKQKFEKEPGQMRLLIVVDKLLTGFDAPPATYFYIDKQMQDHALFQAICRVNRLDGEDKEFGYIIDYKDLFKSIEKAVDSYTSEAFDSFEKSDVEGLLSNRLEKGKEKLDLVREQIKMLCEPVLEPKATEDYLFYFCPQNNETEESFKIKERNRLSLYKLASSYLRSYAALASEMATAGYSEQETADIKEEVGYYEKVREEVKLGSGDYIDLKAYEPAMRHLIDSYIEADESEKISAFDNMSLVELIVERGQSAIDALPKGIRKSKKATAETIENNVRKVLVEQTPLNPKYFEKMSKLFEELIEKRRKDAIKYEEYLQKIVELTKQILKPSDYPKSINSPGKQALFDNLEKNEQLAIEIDSDIRTNKKDSWLGDRIKEREVRSIIRKYIGEDAVVETVFNIFKEQKEYH